jgi:DNA/RNA endonuclease G (NUC1)
MKNSTKRHFCLLAGLASLFIGMTYGQTVKHHSYTTYYNASKHEPDSVSWNLTPAMCSCSPQVRKDAFAQDKLIPNSAKPYDYANSGYDKGHLFSYDDAMCNATDKVECFLMSNMLPQIHAFNAGDWKVLEMQERILAKSTKLHIIAGGIGTLGTLKNGENIPAYMFKAIFMNGAYTGWIMPNLATSHGHKYDYWIVPISELDAKTGLKLK